MKVLSTTKLAKTVSELRSKKNITQAELGEHTNLHRIMIGRIEKEDFIPSITQLEALANFLEFDITDMFIEKEPSNSFIALRGNNIGEFEKKGIDSFLKVMIAIRQQILLRRKFTNESNWGA